MKIENNIKHINNSITIWTSHNKNSPRANGTS